MFASVLHWAISVPASLGKDALSILGVDLLGVDPINIPTSKLWATLPILHITTIIVIIFFIVVIHGPKSLGGRGLPRPGRGLWAEASVSRRLRIPSATGICYKKKNPHTVDIVEGTGVRENAWNFQNVI